MRLGAVHKRRSQSEEGGGVV